MDKRDDELDRLNVLVLGKGSKLYRNRLRLPGVTELSTAEFRHDKFGGIDYDLVVVFSLLSPSELDRLRRKTTGVLVVVGSCAALSKLSGRFKYSRFKASQLNFVENSPDSRVKYVVFGDFERSRRSGLSFYSDANMFWRDITNAASSDKRVVECFEVMGEPSFASQVFTLVDRIFAPLSSILLKVCTRYTYGYNNAKNVRR